MSLTCSDITCSAPGVKRDQHDQWWCLFHPGVRPNIDSYTGKVREDPTLKRQRAKRAAVSFSLTAPHLPPVPKPARTRKPKRPIHRISSLDVLRRYELGHSMQQIANDLDVDRRRVSAIVRGQVAA